MKRRRVLALGLGLLAAPAAASAGKVARKAARKAPQTLAPSPDMIAAVQRIAAGNDHGARPFVVIDKRRAMLWLFDAQARLQQGTPVLLGLARGDHTVPGIGDKPLAAIRVHERTTPAGRFAVERGRNAAGDDVIWVDYDAAVSMHRARNVHASERRLERLASASHADNRISYGCINVPGAFFDRHLWPWVRRHRRPLAYVLPETRAAGTLFAAER